MRLQKSIQLVARRKPQQLLHLRLGDTRSLVLLKRKCLQRRRDNSAPEAASCSPTSSCIFSVESIAQF